MIEKVPGSDRLVMTGFKIVSRPEDADMLEKRIPDSLRPLAQRLHDAAMKTKKNAVADLKDATRKYPKFPAFKNYLYTYYKFSKNYAAAREVAEQMFAQHPEYLYSHLNLAEALMDVGETERIEELLHPSMSLQMLFPQREKFMAGELIAYERTAILYLARTGQFEAAESHLEMIEKAKLMPTDLADDLSMHILRERVAKRKDEMVAKTEHYVQVKSFFKQLVPATDKAPVFHHPEIQKLYEFFGDIDLQLLRELMQLPRETLVADLEAVLRDATARYEWFLAHPEEDFPFAPIHAMLLLGELRATEALPTMLDFMSQDDDFYEYWLGDTLTEFMPAVFAKAAGDDLQPISEYLRRPGVYLFARSAVADGTALHPFYFPEKKPLVVEWLRREINWFVENQDAEGVYDSEFLEMFVGCIIELGDPELLPVAKAVYEKKLISDDFSGDYEEFCKQLEEGRPRQVPASLLDFYEKLKQWGQPVEPMKKEEKPSPHIGNQLQSLINQRLGLTQDKVGRNDPCPCGSGKKYKKCCGG